MYSSILIATKSLASAPLIKFLQEKHHDITVAIPKSHHPLLPGFQQLLSEDHVHVLEEEDLSEFTGHDLILFFEFEGQPVKGTPSIEIYFGQIPESYGPDPLFWSLKNGKRLVYISLIQHHAEGDHVSLLQEKSFDIMPGENIGMLSARLAMLMVTMVEDLLKGIGGGKIIQLAEINETEFPSEEEFIINWNEMEGLQIEHLADACNPRYGGARTLINGAPLQILEVSQANVTLPEGQPPQPPGTIIHATSDQGVFVACKGNTFIRLNIISTGEGFFTGQKLASMGTQPGILLG